jgi:hypothetical protein
MTPPSWAAGAPETPAAFLGRVFAMVQPMVDALAEDAAAHAGRAFDRAELRWLEITPNGSSTQHCQLMWQEEVLFEMQVSADLMQAHLKVDWPRAPH